MLISVGYYYKYALTIKQNEAYEAMQDIADDIVGSFDMFRDLEDKSAATAVTQDTAAVDIATVLADLRHNRISKVVLTDSANDDNDRTLEERDYLTEYLPLVPDPSDPSSAERFDIPEIYARYGDDIFLYPIPDLTTFFVTLYFDKVHPTISAAQNILFPSDFKKMMVMGVVGTLLDMADRKDGTVNDKLQKYYSMKEEKISQYQTKPNLRNSMKCNW